jgi:molybdopterin-biosynthesis enzyme MoeA-like protein
MIVAQLNECRTKYTYVFTTGGIGPTHDDITAECVARAFAVPMTLDADAVERLRRGRGELNEARLKMARVPKGATLIDNPVSQAPGFRIGNVFVYAGIPAIMRAMFAASVSMLTKGAQILSASVDVYAREGDLAEPLERIALAHPEVEIGSYPFARDGRFGASLVVRGTDEAAVERVRAEIVAAMVALAGEAAVSR